MSEEIQAGQETPKVSGLGLELKRGRAAKGFTVERIADELHLRPSIVTAMEEENYELLPADIFLKGYIRSYARLVGLSENEIVQLLEQHLSREADLEAHTKHVKEKEKRKKHSRYALLLLVIAIISGVVLYVWSEKLGNGKVDFFQGHSEPVDSRVPLIVSSEAGKESAALDVSEPATEDPDRNMSKQKNSAADVEATPATIVESGVMIPTMPVEDDSVLVLDTPPVQDGVSVGLNEVEQRSMLSDEPTLSEPVAVTLVEPAEGAKVEGEVVEVGSASVENLEREEGDIQDILPVTPLEQGSVKVVFSGECWFTLKNGEGKTVIAALKRAGDEINYSGSLPFSVVVGAVSEVSMHFDDTPIDFSTVRIRNNRASLELTH